MDKIRKKLLENDPKEDCIIDSSQKVSALAINNSPIVKIDNLNLSIDEISSNERSSIPLPTIQEILRKNVIEKGEFFRKNVCWADFNQNFIIERSEVTKIIANLDSNKIQLLLGDPASGKSIILKNIGYKLVQESNVYYLELKRYSKEEIDDFFEQIFKIVTPAIIIIDDAHLFVEECIKLVRKFKKLENGQLIIGSRESLLFRYGPKDFNEFEDITMIRIESKQIANEIIRLFLDRKYNMSTENIERQIDKFDDFKHDLWLLSWSLMAFKPDKNRIEMRDIYDKVIKSLTLLNKDESIINGEDIFFPLSVFYRFEIRIEKRFLIELGIAQNEIDDLILLGEILEDKKAGTIALHHASIANLYYNTYIYAEGLGGKIRSKFGSDFQYNLFFKYITSKPINLSKIFISLYYDNNKQGVQLFQKLINEKEIQDSIKEVLRDSMNLADTGMCLLPISKMDGDIVRNMLNDMPIELFVFRFNEEFRMERIPLFLMTIKDVDNEFAKMLVDRIDISKFSEKLLERSLCYINSCFMPLYEIDLNIASKLAKELLKEDNIDVFLVKIKNEKRIFFISFFIMYMSIGNIKLAKKLVQSLEINTLIKKVTSPEDVDFLVQYLITISLSMSQIASTKLAEIDIRSFRRYVMAKIVDTDLFSINRRILFIAIADKKLALESMTETYLDLINESLKNETLNNIYFYILCLAFIDRDLARNSVKKIQATEIIKKFDEVDSIYSILDFIDTIAYIDCEMAVNLYIMTIAHAKTTIAQELINAIGLDGRILDINSYLISYFNTSALITERDNKIINLWGYPLIKALLFGWKFNLRKDNKQKS